MKIATVVKSHEADNSYMVNVHNRRGAHVTSMTFSGTNKYADMIAALKLMSIKTIEPVGLYAEDIMRDVLNDGFYVI